MATNSLPTELVQVLRYVEEWQTPHSERNLVKTGGISTPVDFAFTLPHDINSFAFSKYADIYVKDQKLGANRNPIRLPLVSKQNADDIREAVEINKVILNYLYEAELSGEKRQVLAAYVVQKGISSNEAIRDEIFVQLCSQSMGTQTGANNAAVWNLLAACLCCFPPTPRLLKYLLKYVSDNAPAGYDFVCQHKLLHCLQQQQQKSRSNGPIKQVPLSRAYPPSLLELRGALHPACIALNGILPTGERILGQVESWMFAEQFASNLLRQRNLVDPSNSLGWTVALRDEFDVYECAGHDFIMDLISEIEVPPYFPSGSAYFLTTTDALRSNLSSSARQKWPSQPHNAERLRLMLLENDELTEFIQSPISTSSLAPTPEPQSPSSMILTSPIGTARRDQDGFEPTSPALQYLSTSSKLNDRYIEQLIYKKSGPVFNPQPQTIVLSPTVPKPELSTTSKLNTRYAEQVSTETSPVSRPRSYMGDSLTRQPKVPPSAPLRTSSIPTTPATARSNVSQNNIDRVIENVFSGINSDDVSDAEALVRRIKGGGDDKSSPYTTAAELQAALEAQQLQNQLLEQSVKEELLKRQLQELRQQNSSLADYTSVTPAAAPAARPVVNNAPTARRAPPPTWSKPTVRVKNNPSFDIPTTDPVAAISSLPPEIGDLPFSDGSVDLSKLPPPPSPPQSASPWNVSDYVDAEESAPLNALGSQPSPLGLALPMGLPSPVGLASPVSLPSPVVVQVPQKVDTKFTERGSVRNPPPKKLGQIRWPPPSADEPDQITPAKPKPPIGRIRVVEKKETEVTVAPSVSVEEAQRRVIEMINAARLADAVDEVPKKKPVPPPLRPKQNDIAAVGESFDAMKARQEQLVKELSTSLSRTNDTSAAQPVAQLVPLQPAVAIATAAQEQTVPLEQKPLVDNKVVPMATVNVTPAVSFDIHSLDQKRTVLHAQCTEPFFTYDHVNWVLEVRKEVFSPAEKFDSASLMNLIFPQIVLDVLNEDCVRMGKADRHKIYALLEKHGVSARNAKTSHSLQVKREIVVAARELPFYFSRLFAVYGGKRNRRVQMIGVSHSGVRLLTRFKDQFKDYIEVLTYIRFDDLTEVSTPKQNAVVIGTAPQLHIVYTTRAAELSGMIEAYRNEHRELKQGNRGLRQLETLNNNRSSVHDDNDADWY